MPKYKATVIRTMKQRVTVEVEADSHDEAYDMVDAADDPPDHKWNDLRIIERHIAAVEENTED